MAPMMVPREKCSLICHQKHLYAFGGHISLDASQTPTDIIEKYDFHTNTWSVLTSRMPVAMFTYGAFSLGGRIYLPGGWHSIVLGNSSILYCFDPLTGEWSEKTTPPQEAETNCSNKVIVEIEGEKVMASLEKNLNEKAEKLHTGLTKVSEHQKQLDEEYVLGLLNMSDGILYQF